MSEELKPCPFCGGEGNSMKLESKKFDITLWHVTCFNCMGSSGQVKTKEQSIKLWNTRHKEGNEKINHYI